MGRERHCFVMLLEPHNSSRLRSLARPFSPSQGVWTLGNSHGLVLSSWPRTAFHKAMGALPRSSGSLGASAPLESGTVHAGAAGGDPFFYTDLWQQMLMFSNEPKKSWAKESTWTHVVCDAANTGMFASREVGRRIHRRREVLQSQGRQP